MGAMAIVQTEIDAELEKRAAEVLEREGLTVADALREMLIFTAKKGTLPFVTRERSLEENLERLRAYRKRDPEFKLAIAAFVEGELREDDPAEGVPVRGKFIDGQLVETGPAQKKIRELLNA
jgi:addiction module RelB/DinJ family antitoxin